MTGQDLLFSVHVEWDQPNDFGGEYNYCNDCGEVCAALHRVAWVGIGMKLRPNANMLSFFLDYSCNAD